MEDNITSSFSRKILIQGSIIEEQTLRKLDDDSRKALHENPTDNSDLTIALIVTETDGNKSKFESLEKFLGYYHSVRNQIQDLRLDYSSSRGRIDIFFDRDGEIVVSSYGPAKEFHFVSDGILRELKHCDPQYNWLVKLLAFSQTPRKLLSFFILPLSLMILFLIYYYFYAVQIGVDVDPALLYQDNSYLHDVEQAIKSDDISTKIDTLLRGQLKGFTNVSEVLEDTKYMIGVLAITIMIIIVIVTSLRYFSKLYPRTFFAIGQGAVTLTKLERKREIWTVTIGIAFIVNLIAGILVAFVS